MCVHCFDHIQVIFMSDSLEWGFSISFTLLCLHVGMAVDEAASPPSHPGRPGAARGSRPPPLQSAVQPGALGGIASTPARPPEGVALHPALTVAAIASTAEGRGRYVDSERAPHSVESWSAL